MRKGFVLYTRASIAVVRFVLGFFTIAQHYVPHLLKCAIGKFSGMLPDDILKGFLHEFPRWFTVACRNTEISSSW